MKNNIKTKFSHRYSSHETGNLRVFGDKAFEVFRKLVSLWDLILG
jgi:hypothetical protein